MLERSGCPCSAGVADGGNLLLARIATQRAKPGGQFYIPDAHAQAFLDPLAAEVLPGVSYARARLLRERGVETCADLRAKPQAWLQALLGPALGAALFASCRGRETKLRFKPHLAPLTAEEAGRGTPAPGARRSAQSFFAAFVPRSSAAQASASAEPASSSDGGASAAAPIVASLPKSVSAGISYGVRLKGTCAQRRGRAGDWG